MRLPGEPSTDAGRDLADAAISYATAASTQTAVDVRLRVALRFSGLPTVRLAERDGFRPLQSAAWQKYGNADMTATSERSAIRTAVS